MKERAARFIINERTYEMSINSQLTLLELLREKVGLTGTKRSCGIGACGACTVLVEGKAVNSCLTLAVTVRDKSILTIEGLSKGGTLHTIQEQFIDRGAIQCGFCTPGMIMASKALLDVNPDPTIEEIRGSLAGNICRCTGYAKIIDAVFDAVASLRKGGNLDD
jgi:carbon-monoxide dehydrogenase small subunit